MATREELAWAAGFFDGEGCFHARLDRKWGHRYPMAVISQIDRHVLDKFCQIVGVGRVLEKTKRTQGGHIVWYWYTTKWADAQWVLCQLYNWLSPRKQKQGIQMMEQFHATKSHRLGH